MIQFIFCHLVFLFVTCVGIASVRLGGPSIHNKGETMSKRPPLGTMPLLGMTNLHNNQHCGEEWSGEEWSGEEWRGEDMRGVEWSGEERRGEERSREERSGEERSGKE